MHFENWISYRYLRSSKDRFVSVINGIAVVGIAIGVTALIIVIGVMTGFDRDLRDKIVGTNAHLLVEKETGIRGYAELRQKIQSIDHVSGTSPYVHGNVFLEENDAARGLILRGIDPRSEPRVTKINDYMKKSRLEDLERANTIILGSELARYFGYKIGDEVTIIAPGSGLAGQGWRHVL